MGYADIVIVFSFAPDCADVAQAALARLELEAAGARLLAKGGR